MAGSTAQNSLPLPIDSKFSSFDPKSKPRMKNLPNSINPALFAEAERRLYNCEFIYNKTTGPLFLVPERGEWTYDTQTEFYMMLELIQCQVPFTFTRQSDGEYLIMTGQKVSTETQAHKVDKWSFAGGLTKLSYALQGSLDNLPDRNGIIIQGFVCPAINTEVSKYQVNATRQTTRFLATTYVFLGCNYVLTSKFMEELVIPKKLKQPVILIVNIECLAREHILKQWALEVYYMPDDMANYWEKHGEMTVATYAAIARAHTGVLFLISGGPAMPALQIEMSRANPWNQYIAMGSSIEKWTKGYHTRGDYTYNPNCYETDPKCFFRKHPITGQAQVLSEYIQEKNEAGMDNHKI